MLLFLIWAILNPLGVSFYFMVLLCLGPDFSFKSILARYEMAKVRSFQLESCANLVSFKIVVLSIQIKTKNTTILKEMRFAQLSS